MSSLICAELKANPGIFMHQHVQWAPNKTGANTISNSWNNSVCVCTFSSCFFPLYVDISQSPTLWLWGSRMQTGERVNKIKIVNWFSILLRMIECFSLTKPADIQYYVCIYFLFSSFILPLLMFLFSILQILYLYFICFACIASCMCIVLF